MVDIKNMSFLPSLECSNIGNIYLYIVMKLLYTVFKINL